MWRSGVEPYAAIVTLAARHVENVAPFAALCFNFKSSIANVSLINCNCFECAMR